MKKIMLIGIFLSIAAVVCNCSESKTPPTMEKVFGKELLSIFSKFDHAELYEISSKKNSSIKKRIGSYYVIRKLGDLPEPAVEELKKLLLDEKIYDLGYMKKCLFIPEYALVLHSEEKRVDIAVSFISLELRFFYKGKVITEDFDKAENKLKTIVNNVARRGK